jgi:hypothetical protein
MNSNSKKDPYYKKSQFYQASEDDKKNYDAHPSKDVSK